HRSLPDALPIFRSENFSDLPEGEGSCQTEQNYFFCSFIKNVYFSKQFHFLFLDTDMIFRTLFPEGKCFIQGTGPFSFSFFQFLVPQVLCNLSEPGGNLAGTVVFSR